MLTLTAAETGIEFTNDLTETPQLNIIEYLYYYNGGVLLLEILIMMASKIFSLLPTKGRINFI